MCCLKHNAQSVRTPWLGAALAGPERRNPLLVHQAVCARRVRQVGPCTGIDSGDQMWMSRYILQRVAELYNVEATFDPKPIPGDWNGAGGHTNYSTNGTRAAGTGWETIQKMIGKLEKRHAVHIAGYGEGNERRLTGLHETSSMDSFSWGVANRGASVRVGRSVPVEKCGYFEDRRPSSNLDPYVVTKLLVETTLLTE